MEELKISEDLLKEIVQGWLKDITYTSQYKHPKIRFITEDEEGGSFHIVFIKE